MADNIQMQAEGISFSYGQRQVFQNFSLQIQRGEHLAILGTSGCGKTTLLHLFAGLLSPQGGRLLCCGQAMRGTSPQRALVFQDLALFPWLSALGNAAYGLARQGVAKAERLERATQLLLRLGLQKEELHRYPHALSGGQRQRVALARALVCTPRVLLLDEASSALDAATALVIQRELRHLQDLDGFACITVSHRIEEALESADRCLVLAGQPASVLLYEDLHRADRAALAGRIRAHLIQSQEQA
jgi:ABC-type nitrate/sulfonate/bicarbonate transport system ATPase subunit